MTEIHRTRRNYAHRGLSARFLYFGYPRGQTRLEPKISQLTNSGNSNRNGSTALPLSSLNRRSVNSPYLRQSGRAKDDKVDMLAKLPLTALLHIYERMKLGLNLYMSHTVLYSG